MQYPNEITFENLILPIIPDGSQVLIHIHSTNLNNNVPTETSHVPSAWPDHGGGDRIMVVAPPPTSTNSLATVCGRGTTGLQARVILDGHIDGILLDILLGYWWIVDINGYGWDIN
jgi:hypothetical protein